VKYYIQGKVQYKVVSWVKYGVMGDSQCFLTSKQSEQDIIECTISRNLICAWTYMKSTGTHIEILELLTTL